MKTDEIVMIDSDQAARYVENHPVSGWLDRHGIIWKDEGAARYNGCTHVRCADCNKTIGKNHVYCSECRRKRSKERWQKLEVKNWDEKTPLYSLLVDDFFSRIDEVRDYLAENGFQFDDMFFVICERIKLRKLSVDYFGFGPDMKAPDSLLEIINTFNEDLLDIPDLPWHPGKYRAEYIYD